MTEFEQKSRQLSPELYRQFKSSVELGKWPDGRNVTKEQKEILLQAIIIYEAHHLTENERTGVMEDACASRSDSAAVEKVTGDSEAEVDESTLRWH